MDIICCTRYSRLGASSRVRFFLYNPYIKFSFNVHYNSLFDDNYINEIYSKKSKKRKVYKLIGYYLSRVKFLFKNKDVKVLWLQKELFPFLPACIELILMKGKKVVVDYDDATFHTYDQHRYKFVRKLLGNKIDKIMNRSNVVVVGNSYLADRAIRAGAKNVEIIPSVIDIEKYDIKEYKDYSLKSRPLVLGWIGSPGSQKLLESILPLLEEVATKENIILRTVGATPLKSKILTIESLSWCENNEVEMIKTFDVGIMPVQNEPFQKGKCGFKLIQYMACGVPVIASPIGINSDLVQDGVNGYLAESKDDWSKAIVYFINNFDRIEVMGKVGRDLVEKKYCSKITSKKLMEILSNV